MCCRNGITNKEGIEGVAILSLFDSDFLSSGCTPPGKEYVFPAFRFSIIESKLGYITITTPFLREYRP